MGCSRPEHRGTSRRPCSQVGSTQCSSPSALRCTFIVRLGISCNPIAQFLPLLSSGFTWPISFLPRLRLSPGGRLRSGLQPSSLCLGLTIGIRTSKHSSHGHKLKLQVNRNHLRFIGVLKFSIFIGLFQNPGIRQLSSQYRR